MNSFFAVSGLINGILAITFGVFVFLKNKRRLVNQTFALFTLAVTVWAFSYWQWLLATEAQTALFWVRLLTLGSTFIPVTCLHWVLAITEKVKANKILYPAYVCSIILGVLSFNPLLVDRVEPTLFFSWWPKPGVLYHFYLFPGYIGLFIYILFYLFFSYRKSFGLKRLQLKYVLFGLLVGSVGGLTNFPLWYNIPLPPYGNFLVALYPIIFSYTVIRHRLMDVRLAIRAVILRLILVLVLTLAFVAFVALVFGARAVFGEMNWENGMVVAFSFAVFASLFYELILRSIRQVTDKVLFQREYSRQELLKNLGKMMAESLDLNELLGSIERTLLEVMRVSSIRFVLTIEGDNKDNLLLEQLRANPQVLVYDELKREVGEESEGLIRQRLERVVEEMVEAGAAVTVPLPSSKGIVGMIVLGEKKGGDAFTSSDIATLETLMYQAGIAIENASLFTQVQNFNRTLRLEITEATADLSAKNKRLSVLRRLDEIIINTLELGEMAQKVTDVISWEMGFFGGILFLLDKGEFLKVKAVSNTPTLRKAVSALPVPLARVAFKMSLDPSNLLAKAIKEKDFFISSNLADFLVPATTQQVAKAFQNTTGIKHFVCYPLSSKGKSLGVLLFGLHETYNKLDKEEQELLQAFSEQAGIALENAKLYSDLKKANLELTHSFERLKELDQMKDELVSISSHELRTPITAVKSYLWMALNKTKNELSPKLKKYLERAYESSDRMIRLVNDMLSVSRLDGGRIKLFIKRLDLSKLVTAVISELTTRAHEKKIELIFEKSVKNMPKVLADEQMIREVLVNLLDNAIKFTPEKGKIVILLRRRGKMLETLVTDTGLGIAKQDLPKLFQKFGRLEHSFTTMAESGGGTGLGLYISNNIINLHRGKIWARSKVGKGSTFIFSLRIAD